MTTKESVDVLALDVLAVMEDAARRIYVSAETQEDDDASEALLKARAAVAGVFEAAKDLSDGVEFRIDDPRCAKHARLRTALRNAGVKP